MQQQVDGCLLSQQWRSSSGRERSCRGAFPRILAARVTGAACFDINTSGTPPSSEGFLPLLVRLVSSTACLEAHGGDVSRLGDAPFLNAFREIRLGRTCYIRDNVAYKVKYAA